MPQDYDSWKQDEILRDLRQLRDAIIELDEMRVPYQDRRDRLIKQAIERKIPELRICDAAGITRGWIWQIKQGKVKIRPPRTGRYARKRGPGERKSGKRG